MSDTSINQSINQLLLRFELLINRAVMREAFSGFKYVGKADWWSLLTTWVLMK